MKKIESRRRQDPSNSNPLFRMVWAEVDLAALKHNLRLIRRRLAESGAQVLAVVKADAYGHGMKPIAKTLAKEGVNFFGVANIDEAMDLRRVCPTQDILVLGSFHASQAPFFIRHRITPTISSVEDVQVLSRLLKSGMTHDSRLRGNDSSRPFPIHVKIDTGMGRLGIWHEELERLFKILKQHPNVKLEGVYTHFSSADKKDKAATQKQIRYFDQAVRRIKMLGFNPRYFHAANSMGLLRFRNAHLNLVRPGIILYGIQPSRHVAQIKGLKPILSLKTRISFLKAVKKGSTLSYGASYVAPRATQIATLPVGYSHGYRVGYSNKAFVLIRGRKYPVAGRVTMDQTLVDLGPGPKFSRWDTVTLIGDDLGAVITAEDLALLIDSIPYEVVCSIHSRIPRIYKGIKK